MLLPVLAVALALTSVASAVGPEASLEDRTLPFGCSDTIVIGKVRNGTYQPVASKNEILGHGWISAMLDVRKVVRGAPVASALPVKYFAHTYIRHDREFIFVLRHTSTGYEITTLQLMSVRPQLAAQCGSKADITSPRESSPVAQDFLMTLTGV
jgi:hypothetical protein